MESSGDSAQVWRVLEYWHEGLSVRLIAGALNWKGGRRVLDTKRVERAIAELAADKKIAKIDGRWRAVKPK